MKRNLPASSRGDLLFLEEKRMVFHIDLNFPCYPFWHEKSLRIKHAWYSSGPVAYAMFILGVEGHMNCTIRNKDYRIGPGEMLYVPEFTAFHFESSGRMARRILEIKGSNLASILSSCGFEGPEWFDISAHPEIVSSLDRIAETLGSRSEEDFIDSMGETCRFLSRLAFLRHRIREKMDFPRRILEYLERDFSEHISVKSVCSTFGTSPATLERILREHIGMSAMQYRRKKKMERAMYFLYMKNMSVKEVAFRLGYCSAFYFSAEFKRFTGLSPNSYRKEQRIFREQGRDIGKAPFPSGPFSAI